MTPNQQLIEKTTANPTELEVHSIFYTIQGESLFAGCPAVFVRLAGCNLQCTFCDTDYTSVRKKMNVANIVEECSQFATNLVIISGGEPFRQNIKLLVDTLLHKNFVVQIETNGTICPDWFPTGKTQNLHVVMSPKLKTMDPNWGHVSHSTISYKYVMGCDSLEDGLPSTVLGKAIIPARPFLSHIQSEVYLQPEDTQSRYQNDKNQDKCVKSCLTHGHRLCLQIHKIVSLP